MKKKIRVLQVIPELGYGGAETGCYDLAHFLPEQGWKSYIITSGGSPVGRQRPNFMLYLLVYNLDYYLSR